MPPAAPGPDVFERDADEVRNRMAAMQRGWQRGRRRNEEETGADETRIEQTPGPRPQHVVAREPQQRTDQATGPGRHAPGTTSEGDGR